MRLAYALELGEECGLLTKAECINNVLLHVSNLFEFTRIEGEINELIEEAKAQGIPFCECGAAMKDGPNGPECYMKFFHPVPDETKTIKGE